MMKPLPDKPIYETVYPRGGPLLHAESAGGSPPAIIARPTAMAYKAASQWVRRRRLRKRKALGVEAAVISVGNLEVGGNGKTPLAIHLIDHLLAAGYRPVYISRGFKSVAERLGMVTVVAPGINEECPPLHSGVRFVRTDGGSLSAEIGDEGAVVAMRCPSAPLVFCRDRYRAIRAAIDIFGPTHIILDDAFQTWAVSRDLDIVLLDGARPWGNGRLVPAGTLRESPAALRRADCIGINGIGDKNELEEYTQRVAEVAGRRLPVFGIRRRVRFLDAESGQNPESIEGTVAVISSIARPESFERQLVSENLEVRLSIRYPDHHRYVQADIEDALRRLEGGGISCLCTTEKDWVKLRRWNLTFTRIIIARLELDLFGDDVARRTEKPQAMPAASSE